MTSRASTYPPFIPGEDLIFFEVLKHEGVVSIVTSSNGEPHLASTWNSYIVVTEDGRILIPAAIMKTTEKNLSENNKVIIALGSREVIGFNNYQGTGFSIKGTAKLLINGSDYDMMKEKFPFLSRVLEVTVKSCKQML